MNLTDRSKRKFFPVDWQPTEWADVEPAAEELTAAAIDSAGALEAWLLKVEELDAILREAAAVRYIEMTCHADDAAIADELNRFREQVLAAFKPYRDAYARRYLGCPYRGELARARYAIFDRLAQLSVELFREANVALEAAEEKLHTEYSAITGTMTADFDGDERTMQQMALYLKEPDRERREAAWRTTAERYAQEVDPLNDLFERMVACRAQQARNADFANYRDYAHRLKGRFDYTPEDCFTFHAAVEQAVVPLASEINRRRRETLGLDSLRPWDTAVDLDGRKLEPFATAAELTDGGIEILHRLKPEFGANLRWMRDQGYLDLESRKGKAPGGYNYPLAETGVPFIFMNAVGLHRDVATWIHESGHATHTFATQSIELPTCRDAPMEVAELASMAMELLTMDAWDVFYADDADLRKARREQLEDIILFFPWAMTVDAFQHWVYANPDSGAEARSDFFAGLMDRFCPDVDWADLEDHRRVRWHRQLHIFTCPFYYIEYAIAQLGALAVYREYRRRGRAAVDDYHAALKLGYTRPVPEIYERAGIRFDFSAGYVQEIIEFAAGEAG